MGGELTRRSRRAARCTRHRIVLDASRVVPHATTCTDRGCPGRRIGDGRQE